MDDWDYKFNLISEAHALLIKGALTWVEYDLIKVKILKHNEDLEDLYNKAFHGETVPAVIEEPKFVEKDGLLDGEIVNKPVKRFESDFERVNINNTDT